MISRKLKNPVVSYTKFGWCMFPFIVGAFVNMVICMILSDMKIIDDQNQQGLVAFIVFVFPLVYSFIGYLGVKCVDYSRRLHNKKIYKQNERDDSVRFAKNLKRERIYYASQTNNLG